MLQSRAFTPAFRFLAGLAVFALVAAFVVGVSSAVQDPIDRVLGPLTLGWKGGIGNHLGYIFFVGLFGLSAGLAGILVAFRDADPEAEAQFRFWTLGFWTLGTRRERRVPRKTTTTKSPRSLLPAAASIFGAP